MKSKQQKRDEARWRELRGNLRDVQRRVDQQPWWLGDLHKENDLLALEYAKSAYEAGVPSEIRLLWAFDVKKI